MLKLLHIADLHLDSRFAGMPITEAAKRRADLRSVFKNALEFAKKEGCAATLICGDLFDGEYYTSDTLRFLNECFSAMPRHKFIITPGNHDPHGATSPYRFAGFPENVFVFDSEQLTSITFDELKLTVYGYAFTSAMYTKNPLEGFSGAPANGNFNVLCAHTELDGIMSSYAPISKKSLEYSGFEYAALGHIHLGDEVGKVGNTVYAYSGCIAGRDFSEYGEKGGLLVTLDEQSGKRSAKVTAVKFCPWVYETVSVSVNGAPSQEEAISIISKALKPYSKGVKEYLLRLRITGETAFELSTEVLLQRLSDFGVKDIKNDTSFAFSSLKLEDDFSLRGAFYHSLKSKLTSDDEHERKVASLALKYGLTALSQGEIDL